MQKKPWERDWNGQTGSRPSTIIDDPYRAGEEERKREEADRKSRDEQRERERLGYTASGEARSDAKSRIDNAQALRKEYSSLPEVRAFKVATQMASAALGTAESPQGDISLTYSFAKVMDPESVVRDQEANMVTNSQPWFQAAVENVKKQFGMDGAGKFTPEARARLRDEIVKAVASRKPLYEARRREMADVARTNGIPAAEVIGSNDIEAYAPVFREYAVKYGDESGAVSQFLGEQIQRPEKPKAAAMGTTETSIPIPPEMQAAHEEYLSKNWGKLDPQDYAAFRINLDRQYNFGSDPDGYKKSAEALNKDAAAGRLPSNRPIPAVKEDLSKFDQFRNDIVANPYGAGVASALNAATLGAPGFFAPEQTQALREEFPVSSLAGEVVGGIGGTGVAGGLLRGAARGPLAGASVLKSPLAADVAYGTVYGASQADDPLYGAVAGALGGAIGNKVGTALGGAFPSATGLGGAVRQVDETVPSSQQLREMAGDVYQQAENTGEVIAAPETLALNDRVAQLLTNEGRLSPKGRITEVQPKVKEAYGLVSDYAGEEMSPTQLQTVRSVIGDASVTGDPAERRVARALLGEFDDWTEAAAPQMADQLGEARGIASRYLQGDEIALARELADVRAGQFSNSGQGNALRTDFRQLDRQIAKGQQSFSEPVEQSIQDVARGTPVSNTFRNIGRFAPTGPMSALPYVGLFGGSAATQDPLMAAGGVGAALLAYAAREAGQRLTNRSAQVAENLAYGGPEYEALLRGVIDRAGARGGRMGTAVAVPGAREIEERTWY